MRNTVIRGIAAAALISATGLAFPAAAFGSPNGDQPNVVDEPDTSNLHNLWTFAPLGVPVFGAVQSVEQAPGKLLPS